MNRMHTILVVALALAATTGIGWSTPSFRVSAALTEDDSLFTAWPYFRFTQLYEESFVECTFGEFSLHHTHQDPCWQAGTWGFFPIDWNEDQHSPLIGANSIFERRNLTAANMVHAGDTLSWVWSMGGGSLVGDTAFVIPDTVGFILAFHDSATATTIPIDTIRITPISSVFNFWHHVHPLQPGTYEYRHRHVVSSSLLNGDSARVALRVIPTLFSRQESARFSRWDIASAERLSELLPRMSEDLDNLVDSLVSLEKSNSAWRESMQKERRFRIQYSANDRTLTVSVKDYKDGLSAVDIDFVNILGQIAFRHRSLTFSPSVQSASIKLPWLSAGVYAVVLRPAHGGNSLVNTQVEKVFVK